MKRRQSCRRSDMAYWHQLRLFIKYYWPWWWQMDDEDDDGDDGDDAIDKRYLFHIKPLFRCAHTQDLWPWWPECYAGLTDYDDIIAPIIILIIITHIYLHVCNLTASISHGYDLFIFMCIYARIYIYSIFISCGKISSFIWI